MSEAFKSTLRVNKSKLSQLKKNLSDSSNVIEGYNADIYTYLQELGGGWSGPDYDEFVNQFELYRPSLNGVARMFDVYSKKVGEYDEQGEALITAVEAALNIFGGKASSTVSSSSIYNLLDTTEKKEATVAYKVDENPENAKEARLAAENARDNIYADMEILMQELKTIEINKNALSKQADELSKMDATVEGYDNLYEQLCAELNEHELNVNNALTAYSDVYNYINEQTERKFWPWLTDGAFVEANDAWFWTENDIDKASAAAKALNEKLAELPPVTTVVDSAAVNGLLAMSDDYLMKNFANGSAVSSTMMTAAMAIGSATGQTLEKTTDDGTNVVLFNSRAMIQEGYTNDEGDYLYLYGEANTYTFAQDEAYGDYYGEGSVTMDGYDSVAIKDDEGNIIETMTADQYIRRYGGGSGE